MHIFEFVKPIAFHRTLNPKLWAGDALKPEIQFKLLQQAKQFIKSLELPHIPLVDVVITGSNCNLTYTRYSDLDLHIRMNYAEIGDPRLVQDLMQSKKAMWNETHDIKLHRIPVEIYVENVNADIKGSVYSLIHDRWIQRIPLEKTQYDDVSVRAKFHDWARRIEHVLSDAKQPREMDRIRDRLRQYRQAGLEREGEFSTENLTFKALRNAKYLERLSQHKRDLESELLSLPEQGMGILPEPKAR
jgi:hypothetical protein